MNFSHYLAHTNPLFLSMEVLPLRKIFFYKVGLIMYKYSFNLLPECIAHLYLRNDIVSMTMSTILEVVINSEYSLVQNLSVT